MYLQIGKDCIINSDNIIAILSIDYVKNTKEFKNLYKKLEEDDNIIVASDKKAMTLILTEKDKSQKAYITNLGVNTIAKRLI
jgi:hypothetical protein